MACESALKTGLIVLMGEITANATVDYGEIARDTVAGIGYDHSSKGFDYATCGVISAIERQSPDIAQGVVTDLGVVEDCVISAVRCEAMTVKQAEEEWKIFKARLGRGPATPNLNRSRPGKKAVAAA